MKLTRHNKDILKLINRSPKTGDQGWSKVSESLWPMILKYKNELIDLCDELKLVRLSEEGKIVFKWLVD